MAKFKCANCGFIEEELFLPPAKDLFRRFEPGDIFTDRECPKCGALALPIDGEEKTPPTKVLIWMEGGLIQDIGASQEVEIIVIDEDTEGGDPENIKTIKLFGDENKETDFYIADWGTVESTPEYVEHYFNEARKERPKPKEEGAPGGDIPAQE